MKYSEKVLTLCNSACTLIGSECVEDSTVDSEYGPKVVPNENEQGTLKND